MERDDVYKIAHAIATVSGQTHPEVFAEAVADTVFPKQEVPETPVATETAE